MRQNNLKLASQRLKILDRLNTKGKHPCLEKEKTSNMKKNKIWLVMVLRRKINLKTKTSIIIIRGSISEFDTKLEAVENRPVVLVDMKTLYINL